MAPALLWLFGLIVLPHVDLALLSLRARVAPGEYEPSLAQYQTFIDEPLYWHTFVRTAVLSILATAGHAAAGLSAGLDDCQDRAWPHPLDDVRDVPDPVLGQRDGAHAGLDDPAA
jgi:ABC-type spermidine/putrescine transport system permease subunit II